MKQMAPNSLAVFNSNDIYPVSADSTLPFQQHRDLFTLWGRSEETILLLFPDAAEPSIEVLFVRETNLILPFGKGLSSQKQLRKSSQALQLCIGYTSLKSVF